MPAFKDLTGQTFGRLTAIRRAANRMSRGGHSRVYWHCQCKCGREVIVNSTNFRYGNTKSCGCLRRERTLKPKYTHGMANSRLYRIWKAMKTRCSNPNPESWKNYGGRGIRVCSEWQNSFENFRDWSLANGYSENLTIDREDNDGNYEPGNCRWITRKRQCRNKTNNKMNEVAVRVIRYFKEHNVSVEKIAKAYSVHATTIRRIWANQTWA